MTTSSTPGVIARNPKTTIAAVGTIAAAAVQFLASISGLLPETWAAPIAVVIGILTVAGVHQVPTPSTQPPVDPAAVLDALFADWQTKNYAALRRDLTADVVLMLPVIESVAARAAAFTTAPTSAPAVDVALTEGAQAAADALSRVRSA